jgi:GGDEF domain-containing protein
VEALIATTVDDLGLDDAVRGVWDILIPRLALALRGGDDEPLLTAAEHGARGVALAREASVAAVIEGYVAGCEALLAALRADAGAKASRAAELLAQLRPRILSRLAAGYAAGLEDTILELKRQAAAASPVDDATGALKPSEISARLALEVLRCQRMDLSLGVVEMAVEVEGEAGLGGAARLAARREVSDCVRENLRRYDSIGLTGDGGFLLVLPDVSRRGLAAAAERLRREIAECAGEGPHLVLALAHYEYVDVAARDVMVTLDRGMERARSRGESLAWA